MASRRKRVFQVVGVTLICLALLTFTLRVIDKVLGGGWLDSYYSVTFVPWTYGSALVFLVVALVALLIGGLIRLYGWFRKRKDDQLALQIHQRAQD